MSTYTELKLNDYIVLFSYRVPVVAVRRDTGIKYVTKKKWSFKTTKHINAYIKKLPFRGPSLYVDQSFLNNLVK